MKRWHLITVRVLAIAAVPEGLPVAMIIGLAIGMQRMAARNTIVRRLDAVKILGRDDPGNQPGHRGTEGKKWSKAAKTWRAWKARGG